ncbi:MAG: hypothetical protein LBL95_04785, partial [Deltaproteobacteria bacterium]|nr:hypothetical protein [Deltaproteobacteria bacterium]
MTKGSGDFFPPPPTFDQEAAFLDPRPAGSFRGRQAYLFRTLGGPGPLGGQAGLMAMGDRSIRGWLASGYGPLSLFVLDEALENGDQPVAGDAVFHFRPEAPGLGANRVPSPFLAFGAETGARKKNGPRKKGQPPATPLPGGDLFLDPSRGWLMALAEALPGSREAWPAELWPPHDPAAPLAPGVTFIWALGDQLPGLVAGLAASLMGDGQVLVVSGLDGVLEKVAMDLGTDLVSLDPRPTASGHLDQAALETLMERARADRAKEAEEARAEQAIHRRTEDLVSERLDHWTRREGLERSLSHLRDEAFQRQGEWAASEAGLAEAQAGFEAQARRQGGLLGLLGRHGGHGRAQAAKARLEEAEKAMRRARMEMESLLAEARTVEADLAEARDRSRGLPPKEEILAELSALRATGQDLASRAAGLERPIPEAQAEASVLASKKVVLARLGSWLPPGGFETLIVAAPVVTDRKSREALASLALLAKRRLVVAADFHGWSWTAPAQDGQDGQPAWRNLMAAPALEGPLPGTLSFLGPLPPIQVPGQVTAPRACLLPDPSRHAFLGRMGFSSGLARLPLNHPTGPALRAFGDGGPICPASALASVRLAVEAARSAAASGEPGDIYILSPGRAQAALARSLLSDFGSPQGVMAGEPHDFELWPPAPMAILDTALAPPLAGSDLSSPETGRPAILRALSLASGALVVCADPASVEALSPDSVLRGLWARLQDSAWPGWLPPQPAPFWEALDKARDEALFVMPPFGPSW